MSHQDRALELLLTGKTAVQVAALVGVDSRTIRRWKKDPAFAGELSELRQEIHDEIMLRVMALIEKLQTAAFEQLEWLKAMGNKLPALTDKLRCINAISQLNFKWSKFIMDRQDRNEQKTLAAFAKATQKADNNGHTSAVGATEQTAVSFAPCCEAQPIPKADATGHAVVTQASSLPVSGDSQAGSPPYETPKADVNGQSATDPEVQKLAAHRAKVADSKPAQKADKNGHPPSGAWAGKGSNHVPFYRGVAGR